ncbi:MAG TPA: hypothetical protein VM124_02175 [Candidatus Limnocylindrales bacterium]|nr:hypothetical protein [Candidatus Limnocylindrales bacterium]
MEADNPIDPDLEQKPNIEPSAQQSTDNPQPTVSPHPSKSRKKPIIILTVLILIIGGSLAFKIATKKKPNNAATTQQNAPKTAATEKSTTSGPQTIAYATSETDSSQPILYWRPATGGERIQSLKLDQGSYITDQIVRGNQVVVGVQASAGNTFGPQIWHSTDNGKSYTKIFEAKKTSGNLGDQITSIVFANDGKSLAVALLPEDGKNTVKEIVLDTPHTVKDLFTSDSRGVFLEAYIPSSKQVLYFTGCYNCDGNSRTKLWSTNIATKSTKIILDGQDTNYAIRASQDGQSLLAMKGTLDPALDVEGIGGMYQGPPYTLITVDLSSGKETTLTTFGKKGTRKPDGSLNTSSATFGYMADGKTPYYVIDNQIYKVNSTSPSLLFEATKPIMEAYYVSDDMVYVTTGVYNNFVLDKFVIPTKTLTTILNGDDKTRIFGVTAK